MFVSGYQNIVTTSATAQPPKKTLAKILFSEFFITHCIFLKILIEYQKLAGNGCHIYMVIARTIYGDRPALKAEI
jgi:hypothetical protein